MLELFMSKLITQKYNRDINVNNNSNNNNNNDSINYNLSMGVVFRHFIDYHRRFKINGVHFDEGSLVTFDDRNNTTKVLTSTDYICKAFPESSKVLECLINAPLNSIYSKTHLFFKTLSHFDKEKKRRFFITITHRHKTKILYRTSFKT